SHSRLGHLPVELGHLRVQPTQGLGRILVLEHQDDALDHVGIVVLTDDSFALLVAQRGASEIVYQHRRAVELSHDDCADILQGANQAHTAYYITLIATGHAAATGVGVVAIDRVDDVVDTEAIVLELLWVQIELVFGGEAAEVRHLDDPGHRLERWNHLPA